MFKTSKLKFNVRSKRRLYKVTCSFDDEQYQVIIKAKFEDMPYLEVGEWIEVNIETDPLDFAKQQIERFEKQEDYRDKYGGKLFYLDEEAEQQAKREEAETAPQKVFFSDWETGRKGFLVIEKEEAK